MAEYKVTQDYSSEISVNGSTELLVLTNGSVVELDDDQAAAVERDGPGVLGPVKGGKTKEATGEALPALVDMSLSVPNLLVAVGDDQEKARFALDQENAAENPRKGVVSGLEAVLAPPAD